MARRISLSIALDPVQVRSPGQPETETNRDDEPTRLEAAVDVRIRERDARRRSVPETVQIHHDPILRYLHLASRCLYYACIGLVRDDVLDIVEGDCVTSEELLHHLGQDADGELEDLAAVLVELVIVAGVACAAQRSHPAVGSEDVVYEAGGVFAAVEEYGAGAVAEEDSGRAILLVDDGAHGVGAYKEHPVRPLAHHHRVGYGYRVGEAGAGGGEVHRADARGPDRLADQTRDRRHGLRRGRGGADDQVNRIARRPGVIQGLPRRLDGEGGAVLVFADEPALGDPGARGDPILRRVEGGFEVAVGDDPAPEGATDPHYLAASPGAHPGGHPRGHPGGQGASPASGAAG